MTESPNYDNYDYITSLKLDSAHSEQYADFLPELFSRIYLAQTTEGVKPIEGHEQESQAVLSAVQAALNQALTASKPTLTVLPEKTTYANADEVTVTLGCPTDGAEIYYTVDNSNTLTGSTVSDPTKTGIKYTDPFEVPSTILQAERCTSRAAAKKDGKWSGIVRKDLTFAKGVKENAFVVDGTNYQSWSAASAAVKKGGTIVLNDDVQLTEEDKLPDVACTIRSADGETKYRLSGSPMTMNADLTLSNISYALGNLYANGHNLTISNDVETRGAGQVTTCMQAVPWTAPLRTRSTSACRPVILLLSPAAEAARRIRLTWTLPSAAARRSSLRAHTWARHWTAM